MYIVGCIFFGRESKMNSKGTSLKGGHHSKADISDWLVLPYIHIIIVCKYALYKADTSLRQTARAGPKGVWLRQNSLYTYYM